MPKYPDITVQLSGGDGNAFAILGAVIRAARQGGLPEPEIQQFRAEATAGDYHHLLATCMAWFNVE